MKRFVRSLVLTGMLATSATVTASPSKVASCVNYAITTLETSTKIAAKLCQEFKTPALYSCFQQALGLGLTPEQGIDLCRKADTLTPINCFQLVRIQTRLSPAEAAIACHGDKP